MVVYFLDNSTYSKENGTDWDNSTNGSTPEYDSTIQEVLEATPIFYFFVALLSLWGNSLVIFSVFYFGRLRTAANMYIAFIALSDMISLIDFQFRMQDGSWPHGWFTCKIHQIITPFKFFMTSYLLTLLSAERCVHLAFPKENEVWRIPKVALLYSLMGFVPYVCLASPIFVLSRKVQRGNYTVCYVDWTIAGSPEHAYEDFIWYCFLMGFAAPLTYSVFLYSLAIGCYYCSKKRRGRKKPFQDNVTYLVLIITFVYGLCWAPHWIMKDYIKKFSLDNPPSRSEFLLSHFTTCLADMHSAINPILYFLLNRKFRLCFIRTMRGCPEWRPKVVVVHQYQINKDLKPCIKKKKKSRKIHKIPVVSRHIRFNVSEPGPFKLC